MQTDMVHNNINEALDVHFEVSENVTFALLIKNID